MSRSVVMPVLVGAFLAACAETGQDRVVVPLVVVASGRSELLVDGWTITFTRADIALGPVYLCATRAASPDLCPVAVGEFAGAVQVDALDAASQQVGLVSSVTGTVGSAMFDLGIAWVPTWTSPRAVSGSGGHSAVFEGSATDGARSFTFAATLDVLPQSQGVLALQGQPVTGALAPGSRVEISLSPEAWWAAVDLAELHDLASGGALVIAPGSRAHNALVVAMVATAPPILTIKTGEP